VRTRRTVRSFIRLGALAATAAVIVAACSSSKSSTPPTTAGSSATTVAGATATTIDPLTKAQASTALAEKGTYRNVDPTSRPAVKGKHIVVISAGESSISSQVPSDAAEAAAKAIGWQVQLYDAKLNPANWAPLVRQAIAAHADGIVLNAVDCDQVQQPLQEAKAAGIVVIPIYAFDCTDAHAGNESTNLFSANINYGPRAANIDAFTESYGADQANYIIAASHNAAKIIAIQDPEFTVLYYTLKGFADTIAASGGSKIVDTLNVTQSDLLSGKLPALIEAELLRFPDATWIKSPYTYVTTLGISAALASKPAGSINVMGGEGFQPELDLIRKGVVTAANVISSEWTGWASIDTMNSAFSSQKPADSGIGWQIADKTTIPPSGPMNPTVDFKSEYLKAWGVS
jgi:ribose transport system substrate-binding protein